MAEEGLETFLEVTNRILSRRSLEGATIEGDSPVGERMAAFWNWYPSTTGHVEPCGNPGGPSPKAKYYPSTDSEPVP